MGSVGTWTRKLSALFADINARPAIHIDGPFYAPTVSMPSRSTVVGIGSGVGVTPFLSFLGSMATAGEEGRHKHAHVFWTSPWATDFLLFRDLLGQVDKRTASGGCCTTFHLHAQPRSRHAGGVGKLEDQMLQKGRDDTCLLQVPEAHPWGCLQCGARFQEARVCGHRKSRLSYGAARDRRYQ